MTTKDAWFKILVIVLGMLLSVLSAAGGFVYSSLDKRVISVTDTFDSHRADQWADDLRTAERLKAIEVNQENQTKILEQILVELKNDNYPEWWR